MSLVPRLATERVMPKRATVASARGARDPERVRAAVLDASVKLFAERGFAGTSFQNISDACGISVGLIQYHFGNKEELYEAVKKQAITTYVASQEPQFRMPVGDLFTFLDLGLRQYFRFFERHPEWPRLSSWAELEGDGRAWPGESWLMDRLVERFEAERTTGKLRADADPELLLIVLAGIMQGWLRYRVRNAKRLAAFGAATEQEDAYMRFVLGMLRHGISTGPVAPKAARAPRSVKSKRRRA